MNILCFDKYAYKDRVEKEIKLIKDEYSNFVAKMDHYFFNNGVEKTLISLIGHITVNSITQCNIPICVYLPENYPLKEPFVYVRPTCSMQICPTEYVDAEGRVSLPYLNEWIDTESDIHGLLTIIQIDFNEQPPLVQKLLHQEKPILQNNNPDFSEILEDFSDEFEIWANLESKHLDIATKINQKSQNTMTNGNSKMSAEMNKLDFSRYSCKDQIKNEIQEIIDAYPGLSPTMKFHVNYHGCRQNLVSIYGTIEIHCANDTYKIPICIYFPDTYPYEAPFAYVITTSQTRIKPNKYVDGRGCIDLPYLKYWSKEKSDIQGLLSMIQIEFSGQFPIFAESSSKLKSIAKNNSHYFPS